MNLFLVERTDKWGYDDYSAFVCYANSAEEARYLAPDPEYHEWQEDGWHYSYGTKKKATFHGWVDDPTTLKVWGLDRSPADGKPSVILASYNAG